MLVKRPAKTNPEKLNKLINDSKLDAMFKMTKDDEYFLNDRKLELLKPLTEDSYEPIAGPSLAPLN